MRIIEIETILLTGPCTSDPYLSEARKLRSVALIRIRTDTELVGVGETYAGYFFPEVVPEIVDFFKPILIGNGIEDIPELTRRMYHCGNFWCRVGLGAAVLAGIEAALWDLRGKELDEPVYKIIGDAWKNKFCNEVEDGINFKEHIRIPCYATGGPSNYPIEKLENKVEFYCSLGFKGVKIGAGAYWKDVGFEISEYPSAAADFEAHKFNFLRRRFGEDLSLMLDAHMGNSSTVTWELETAVSVAKQLEPFNLFFFEEPLHYTNAAGYSELCLSTEVPIAGGECLTSVSEWQVFIDQKCFTIGQPDASFITGLSQFMEVAVMLDKQGQKMATHSWGAGASLMQNIHGGFACPNTVMLEVAPAYGPLHSEMIGDGLRFENGYIYPPEKPGLGINITDELINKFPFVPGSGEFNSVPGKVLIT